MFELIIFIIIISVVLKSKNKNKKTSTKPNVPRQAQQSRPAQPKQQGRPSQQPTPIPGRSAQSRPAQNKPVKEEMSTTEMLEAKALADDREEMREKQRQRMENKKHYGHLKYADKYILGDSVPKGKKMVFCPYCNAENLIPTYSATKDYNCYFCREDL